MMNGECIYRKTVDYMSRMALEKDDSRRFSVIWKLGRGARCIKFGNGPLSGNIQETKMAALRKRASVTTDHVYATFQDNSASILGKK